MRYYLALLRPRHWIKNLLVIAPILFAFKFTHQAMVQTAMAFAALCLIASFIYIINDLADAERDRLHTKKKHRPIASGKVRPAQAIVLVGFVLAGGLLVCNAISRPTLVVCLIYLILNFGLFVWPEAGCDC